MANIPPIVLKFKADLQNLLSVNAQVQQMLQQNRPTVNPQVMFSQADIAVAKANLQKAIGGLTLTIGGAAALKEITDEAYKLLDAGKLSKGEWAGVAQTILQLGSYLDVASKSAHEMYDALKAALAGNPNATGVAKQILELVANLRLSGGTTKDLVKGIEDIGKASNLSAEEIKALKEAAAGSDTGLRGNSKGANEAANSHRSLATQLGVSRYALSRMLSEVLSINPALSQFASLAYTLIGAFSPLDILFIAIDATLLRFAQTTKQAAQAEEMSVVTFDHAKTSLKDVSAAYDNYLRLKQNQGPIVTGFYGAPPIGPTSIPQPGDTIASVTNEIAKLKKEMNSVSLFEGLDTANKRITQFRTELQLAQEKLLALQQVGKGGTGLDDKSTALSRGLALSANIALENLKKQDEQARLTATSVEALTDAYLKNRGLSIMDLRTPEDTGPMADVEAQAKRRAAIIAAESAKNDLKDIQDNIKRSQAQEAVKFLITAEAVLDPASLTKAEAEFDRFIKVLQTESDPTKISQNFRDLQDTFKALGADLSKLGTDANTTFRALAQSGNGPELLKRTGGDDAQLLAIKDKIAQYDAQHTIATAQDSAAEQEYIGQLFAEAAAINMVVTAAQKKAALDTQAANQQATLARIAQLPTSEQVKLNQEIAKYVGQAQLAGTTTGEIAQQVLQIAANFMAARDAQQALLNGASSLSISIAADAAAQEHLGLMLRDNTLEYKKQSDEIKYQLKLQIDNIDYAEQHTPRNDTYYRDRAHEIARFYEDAAHAAAEFNIQTQRANANFQRELARQDAQYRRDDLRNEEEYNIRRKREAEDHQIDMQRLQVQYLFNLGDAVAERDAVTALKLERNYKEQVKEKEQDFALQQQREEEDHAREIALRNEQREIDRQYRLEDYARQQSEREADFARQKAWSEHLFNEQLAWQKIQHDAMLAQLHASYEFQREEARRNAVLQAEAVLHAQAEAFKEYAIKLGENTESDRAEAEKKFKIIDDYYGAGGKLQAKLLEFYDLGKSLTLVVNTDNTEFIKKMNENIAALKAMKGWIDAETAAAEEAIHNGWSSPPPGTPGAPGGPPLPVPPPKPPNTTPYPTPPPYIPPQPYPMPNPAPPPLPYPSGYVPPKSPDAFVESWANMMIRKLSHLIPTLTVATGVGEGLGAMPNLAPIQKPLDIISDSTPIQQKNSEITAIGTTSIDKFSETSDKHLDKIEDLNDDQKRLQTDIEDNTADAVTYLSFIRDISDDIRALDVTNFTILADIKENTDFIKILSAVTSDSVDRLRGDVQALLTPIEDTAYWAAIIAANTTPSADTGPVIDLGGTDAYLRALVDLSTEQSSLQTKMELHLKRISAHFNEGDGGPKAVGGIVTRGRKYLVGENGPEMFSPSTDGTIVSNAALESIAQRLNQLTTTLSPQPSGISDTTKVLLQLNVTGDTSKLSPDFENELYRNIAAAFINAAGPQFQRGAHMAH